MELVSLQKEEDSRVLSLSLHAPRRNQEKTQGEGFFLLEPDKVGEGALLPFLPLRLVLGQRSTAVSPAPTSLSSSTFLSSLKTRGRSLLCITVLSLPHLPLILWKKWGEFCPPHTSFYFSYQTLVLWKKWEDVSTAPISLLTYLSSLERIEENSLHYHFPFLSFFAWGEVSLAPFSFPIYLSSLEKSEVMPL